MARRRLSDVAAIASTPINVTGVNESVSVCVRQIDNGFVTTKSRSTQEGYKCSEEYSQTKPQLGEIGTRMSVVGEEGLRGAVASLKVRSS